MARARNRMESGAKRKLTLAICCGAHGVQDGLGAALYILMPVLAQAFGLTYAQVGMIQATKNIAMSLFEFSSGMLSERFGERRLLVFGLICAGLGYLSLAIAATVSGILLSFLIIGTGSAFQHALSSSIISNSSDVANRRTALGLYNSAGDAGKLTFTGMIGLAIGAGIAWQGAVVFFGLTTLVFALVLLAALRNAGVGGRRSTAQFSEFEAKSAGWGIENPASFSTLCLTVFLDTAVQSGFLVFLVFVIADKGVSAEFASLALVLTLVGGMFGKAGCGYLAQKYGVRHSFALVQCATAACIVALVFAAPVTAFVILPVLGMFLQGSTSITYGSISDVIRSDRQSRGFALMYSVSGLSSIAAPIVFGLLSDAAGLNAALLAMAAVSLLAIPPCLLLKPSAAI